MADGACISWDLEGFGGYTLPTQDPLANMPYRGEQSVGGMAMAEFGYPSGWLSRVPEGGASPFGWLSTFAYYMGVWVLMMFTFDYAA